ncbi:MAG: tyrosine-type recombinase/integrase [Blastococcus sp.]
MGYIRKLPSGRWQATVRHPSGRKLTKSDPLKRVVQAWAAETEASFRNGELLSERGRGVTVQAWHDRWILARNVEARTAHEERLRLDKYVLPQWGAWPMRSIGRIDVQAWVTQLGRERGPNVAVGCYRVFHKMLADAELEGLLPTSPCRRIDLPKIQLPAPRWLTREEYDRLLLAFDGARQGPQWRAMVAVACNTGLRSGELSGLDVRHVDFDRQLVHVEQVMTKFGLRDYPKSQASRRTVHLPDEAAELLWPTVADRRPAAPAFPAPRGGRLDQSNFLKTVWHPALERAGIEPVRAYVTRHTFASWAVQAGVPLWDIAQALGHNSLEFVNRYAFLQPNAHDAIRAAFARRRGAWVAHDEDRRTGAGRETAGQSPEMH